MNTTTPPTTSPDRLPGMLITIDGPGGVGKSTTSQLVAVLHRAGEIVDVDVLTEDISP
ncbi:MAG: hypothetical protein WAN20_18730 [Pseudonocardiaceae bacterium]